MTENTSHSFTESAEYSVETNKSNSMTTSLYNEEKTFEQLNIEVLAWAKEKGILEKATPLAQIEKTTEEVNETFDALVAQADGKETYKNSKGKICNTEEEILDGFGDILVTVLIGCKMQGIEPKKALQAALDIITKRTGKMINGQFVKDEDLKV